jgi:NADPH-dependent ferric siderophore reductase
MSKHKKKKHEDAGSKKKMLPAQVEAAEWVGDRFRLVDILAEGCLGVRWQPGAKLKVDVGDRMTRTFTPIAVKAKSGSVRILVYIHGESAASRWASAIRSGEKTFTSTPRSSLDFSDLMSAAVFFGDETSFGAAKTLQSYLSPDFGSHCFFEVKHLRRVEAVVKRLELANVTLIQTRENGSHLGEIAQRLQRALTDLGTKHLVLTGNGRSIQRIRTALKANEATDFDYLIKAYWTPEKTLRD